jgi:lon-related putative ATP-dependent protease
MPAPSPLSADKLRNTCDPKSLGIHTTDQLPPLEGIIGQQRAVRALEFGLEIPDDGFNVYVAGVPGTGKMTAVQAFLEERAAREPVPPDWCYVNNFSNPYEPKALKLPAGTGVALQMDMRNLVKQARTAIQKAFESDEYAAHREEILQSLNRRRSELFEKMSEVARQRGFLLQLTPMGLVLIPAPRGEPLQEEQIAALTPEQRQELETRREVLEADLKSSLKLVREIEKEAQKALQELDRKVGLYAVEHLMEDLLDKYEHLPEVSQYLKEVQEDILQNLELFRGQAQPPQSQPAVPMPPAAKEMPFRNYQVNVLVDNSRLEHAPVVTDLNPLYNNLFGRIEKEAQFGALYTDFTLIRPGSLHRANGGYLVLPILEVLRNPFVWDSLKRAIRNREIVIEEMSERLGFVAARSLRPEPVPLEAKVILIGSPLYYYLLGALDEDFRELFKVKADFDTRMDRTDENIKGYLAFICNFCTKVGLRQLDAAAAAKVIEHGSRLAEHQEKLSTQFADIADLLREANFWAGQDGAEVIGARHVQRAIDEKIYRSNLLQERIQEMIEKGTILIDVHGESVGRVNGLAVVSLGDYSFGRPNRITASTAAGSGGVIDIEREAKLGGPIHTKGVQILSGYLHQKYAQDKPLSMTGRLVFEQSYEGVEGDSASSTELYAILSSLSGLPIKQGIAVTGSVNQHGEVQAIGGVNEKIEGFFEVCRAKGLTGEQGVMIPASNMQNLMLKEEVVQAVKEGKFHIWPVSTIDEGISLLTGVAAGERREDGTFEPDTVNALVDERLRQFGEKVREFGREDEGREVEEEEEEEEGQEEEEAKGE